MASITTRAGKGAPLTNAELDANFTNINSELATAAITGGTINGATVGAVAPSTGAFTQLNVDNVRVDGNIISTTNTNGSLEIAPNGTGGVNVNSTSAVTVAKGTTAERPAVPQAGDFRFNTQTSEFEGFNGTAFASVGGAGLENDISTTTDVFPLFADATTGTASSLFTSNAKLLYKPSTGEFKSQALVATNGIVVNSATIDEDYTIATGENGHSVGPLVVNAVVTVSAGSVWQVS